ncbi:Histone acetyltransferase HPA2 -related acetyltransferase [Collimonas arenae]|uniref:Histone acetyltransferase HPA2-related acetyltransferase n=1 Tax=Collimonas arenae TaxID=279058 RepID=A0A0A1FAQ3_9BURK|nr:GNAT family N-acetyltransferase [Collimonas arenae]AIY40835.1 Histone acetyltransferase HPA2 -related acetyltransferase [Collimonas arenae]
MTVAAELTPPIFDFRSAASSDAAAISGLIQQFLHEFAIHPESTGTEKFIESISPEAETRYIADPRYQYIAAFEDKQLAGFIALRDGSHVFHLFVSPAFQRRGLATRLWQMAKAAALSVSKPECFTVNSSPFAMPVYTRFGFKEIGPKTEAHGIHFIPMRLQCMECTCDDGTP